MLYTKFGKLLIQRETTAMRDNDYCSYGERKPKETVSLVDGHIDKSNKCVSCGTDIPEGTWTCPICDKRWE